MNKEKVLEGRIVSLKNELSEMGKEKMHFVIKSRELSKLLTGRDIEISNLKKKNRKLIKYFTYITIVYFIIVLLFIGTNLNLGIY